MSRIPRGRRLFRFAVVADTHVNPRDDASSSPFPTNALANDRARRVFAEINAIHPPPDFVLHLGDIVHPVPELPSFGEAVARFKDLAGALRFPLHLMPGNHDVGDKRIEWMPAGAVSTEHVTAYRRLFGPDFYGFDSNGCRFLVLDAQVLNSGLAVEEEQRHWLQAELDRLQGRRWFLALHYPPYVTERDEPGTYDNIDEPARSWLLGLVERYSPEALFAGHVHNFWYDVVGQTEMYLLPATSFLRHDYTEFYRVEPGPDSGRDDVGKFGFFLVDVHEHGHVAHCVRTFGRTLAADAVPPRQTAAFEPVHTKTNDRSPVGVDLRHPWAELVEIAATGGVQEFERKKARNDYLLLAMCELGVRRLRVPAQDLLDPRLRRRMRLMRDMGFEFHVHLYGIPGAQMLESLRADPGLVGSLEVVLPVHRFGEAAALRPLCDGAVEIFLSKLRKTEDAKVDGSRFNHFINHGFVAAEAAQMLELCAPLRAQGAAHGAVFRVPRHQHPVEAIGAAMACARQAGLKARVHLRIAAENPAEAMKDDWANACRVAETAFTALAAGADVFFDTFMDVDRGYFPRTGFIDRRFNPRLASAVYASLHAATRSLELNAPRLLQDEDGCRILRAGAGAGKLMLVLPERQHGLSPDRLRQKTGEGITGLFDLGGHGSGPYLLEFSAHTQAARSTT